MREDYLIIQKVEAIFEKMACVVLWQDLRDTDADRELSGYLTRSAGSDAPWEFRFRHAVKGLRAGAVLRTGTSDERWVIVELAEEELDGQLLYVAAKVASLEPGALPEAAGELAPLLQALRALLPRSTLGPLDRGDVTEALDRLASLCARPGDRDHAIRIKPRLFLLRERFKSCPQVAGDARGVMLRLEALLKRKGLP